VKDRRKKRESERERESQAVGAHTVSRRATTNGREERPGLRGTLFLSAESAAGEREGSVSRERLSGSLDSVPRLTALHTSLACPPPPPPTCPHSFQPHPLRDPACFRSAAPPLCPGAVDDLRARERDKRAETPAEGLLLLFVPDSSFSSRLRRLDVCVDGGVDSLLMTVVVARCFGFALRWQSPDYL